MFPEVSAITSSAAAILVSPILGSYERVCIGAVSIIDGDVEVGIIGLTEPISKMGEIIRLVAEQLKEHLLSGGLLAEFKPMAAGFFCWTRSAWSVWDAQTGNTNYFTQ